MKAYYNEHDRQAAAWLRELIKQGVITDGTVDERSIEDVIPAELAEFDRCHFFAGIGVWDYALNRAGWPDDRQVWTGSCPCQPFSAAGKSGGFADERHLWPAWFHLIEQCRPRTIFGEQVSSKDTIPWIDLVQADLEGALYTVGAADLCSPSVGAPHIRQRLYFVADSGRWSLRSGRSELGKTPSGSQGKENQRERLRPDVGNGGEPRKMDNPTGSRCQPSREKSEIKARNETRQCGPECGCTTYELADTNLTGQQRTRPAQSAERNGNSLAVGRSESGNVEHSEHGRPAIEELGQESRRTDQDGVAQGDTIDERFQRRLSGRTDSERETLDGHAGRNGPTNGFWRDAEWIYCRDEKYRPIEPGSFPLATGTADRVGRLRGYGNSIVAPLAQAWIESYLDLIVE